MDERLKLTYFSFYTSIIITIVAIVNILFPFFDEFTTAGLLALMSVVCVGAFKMLLKSRENKRGEELG